MKLTEGNGTVFCKFASVKKLVVIVCMLILIKPVVPVLEYALDYEYISTVLCINKAKPEMKCNGKCHLMKELAKASEKESPVSDKKGSHTETETLYFLPDNSFTLAFTAASIAGQPNFYYSDLYQYLNASISFHPPSFIS